LFLQLHVFTGCFDPAPVVRAVEASRLPAVVYLDVNDPRGVGVLTMSADEEAFTGPIRALLSKEPFVSLAPRPDFTMMGRSYGSGREEDLEDWLLRKPMRNALNPEHRWHIWYPLRRSGEFNRLSRDEQGKMMLEHAVIGKAFGEGGHAYDIRLECHGLDRNDNDFVLGLVSSRLHPLSRLVKDMRHTRQTAEHILRMGPFFVGRVAWQSPLPPG
jgi:chlorite dismutase